MMTPVPRRASGSALLLAMVAFIIMAGIGSSLFSMSLYGRRNTVAASNGDSAYHVAEAGIDDTINKLKAYQANQNLTSADFAVIGTRAYSSDYVACNLISGSIDGGTYSVTLTPPYNGIGEYKISSIGRLNGEARGIETWIVAAEAPGNSRFGLFGDVFLDTGGSMKTDGYRSADGTYASQITTTVGGVAVANMTGHIGSNGGVDISGSSMVYGNATPGPGETVTGGGTVYGSTTPATQTEPLPMPDFTVPAGTTAIAAISSSTTLNSGVYSTSSVSPNGSSIVTINGNVTLYVSGDFVFTGNPQLKITAGSTLTVYQNSSDGTAKLTVAGGSVVNTDKIPSSLMINSNTTKGKLTGNADFYGTVNAPGTSFSILGTSGFFGAAIAKSLDITGTPFFHYDESLASIRSTVIVFEVQAVRHFVPKK